MRFLLTIAVALSFSIAARAAEPSDPVNVGAYTHPQQKVEVAPGSSLNLVCMGSGERTVLFDAGGSDWSVIWALVQPEVARHARACAYDRAGLGYSDAGRGPRSPIAIVEDMHALIKAGGLKRPLVLVGHSLGGFNVKLYAALYPDDVAALILVDPSEERDWDRSRDGLAKKFGKKLTARSELLDMSFRTWLMTRYKDCKEAGAKGPLDPSSITYRRCSDPVRPQLGPLIAAERQRLQVSPIYQEAQSSEILNSIYGGTSEELVYERLFRPGVLGKKPLIVLTHGNFDAADPLDAVGAQRIVPNTGHNIPVEAPRAIQDAILEVLSRLRD